MFYASPQHIAVDFSTVISFIPTNCLHRKCILLTLAVYTSGVNRRIEHVARGNMNICNKTILPITGLVIQIVKTIRFTGTMHISAFGVSETLSACHLLFICLNSLFFTATIHLFFGVYSFLLSFLVQSFQVFSRLIVCCYLFIWLYNNKTASGKFLPLESFSLSKAKIYCIINILTC